MEKTFVVFCNLARLCGEREVAIKMFLPTRTEPQDFLDEAKMMKKFNHPHIVSLLGVCSEGLPIFIITELMPMGDLLEYLRNDGGLTLHTDHLLKYAAQVRTGVDPLILHYSTNIFHASALFEDQWPGLASLHWAD